MLNPPYLVVRPGRSFWVETHPVQHCVATLQAFREGCFVGAWCYDAAGGAWPVLEAKLKKRPSLLDRALPWRRVAVELRVGSRSEADLADLLVRIREVLHGDNDFCEYLRLPAAEILAQFQQARTTADVITVANRHISPEQHAAAPDDCHGARG